MARLTLNRLRDNIDLIQIAKGTGLANDQHLKRRVLERHVATTGNVTIASALEQQHRAIERHAAAQFYMRTSTSSKTRAGNLRRKDFKTPEGFNECGSVSGRTYASRAGERMEAKQAGFPDVTRHPTTINLMIGPLDGNLKTMTDKVRPEMREAFKGLSEGHQVSGAYQIALKTAEYLATIFPADELPNYVDPVERPDEVFAMLHWHGVIADPHLSKREVRRIVSTAYPGCRRVCVSKVRPERTDNDGKITHGAQGYFEYSCLDKTEVKFKTTKQIKDAIIGHAHLSTTWSRRNRNFSMGKPLEVSGIQIDPSRVVQLELEQRLDDIKRNWEKLDYAQRFIHVWMSGMVSIIKKPRSWLKYGASIRDRFLEVLSLIRKWSTDISAQDIDFFDYVMPPLE